MLKLVEDRDTWQLTVASRDRDLTDQLATVVAFKQELLQWHADLLASEESMQEKEHAWQEQLAELDVALGSIHELARLRQVTRDTRAPSASPAPAPPSDMSLQAAVGPARMSAATAMAASSNVPKAAQASIAASTRANAAARSGSRQASPAEASEATT
jgi:hypothetical protein